MRHFTEYTIGSLLQSANKYLKKAVESRENFYDGKKEAGGRRRPNQRLEDAEYAYATSVAGKQQIADNQWNMQQAQTFSLAASGELLQLLLTEQRRTNELLEQLVMQRKY